MGRGGDSGCRCWVRRRSGPHMCLLRVPVLPPLLQASTSHNHDDCSAPWQSTTTIRSPTWSATTGLQPAANGHATVSGTRSYVILHDNLTCFDEPFDKKNGGHYGIALFGLGGCDQIYPNL